MAIDHQVGECSANVGVKQLCPGCQVGEHGGRRYAGALSAAASDRVSEDSELIAGHGR
jgi:hypothetical protein